MTLAALQDAIPVLDGQVCLSVDDIMAEQGMPSSLQRSGDALHLWHDRRIGPAGWAEPGKPWGRWQMVQRWSFGDAISKKQHPGDVWTPASVDM